MAADIAAVAFVAVVGGVTYWLMMRFLRRRGYKLNTLSDLPPAKRRIIWVCLAVTLVVAAFCGWAFANGHAAIGIAVLVAVYVLPEFVLLPFRIRRSRQAAEAARARRKGTTAP